MIYYFFAIIGMEIFGEVNLRDCCNGSTVAANYNYSLGGYYYLNSFENILVSGVTLFDLMVVNNWFIIMEGFTAATGNDASRVFFMLYFIVMMVVLTIVVAFILEGFLFRIQCSRVAGAQDVAEDKGYFRRDLEVGLLEISYLCSKGDTITEKEMRQVREFTQSQEEEILIFEGIRWKNRMDFSTELYTSEIEKWINQSKELGTERRYTLLEELIEDMQSD